MTFMCTVDGELVPGGDAMPWPRPWAFRCDDCGRLLPYGVALYGLRDDRISRDQARCVGSERATEGRNHVCGDCDGFTEQIGLGLA